MADRPLPAYEGEEPYVFVSYSHEDEDAVYPEIRWLQDQGFNIWYDEGISGASRWRDAIAGRLGGCHLLLFFVSPRSVESQVCREELEFVLDGDRPVLSIHLEATALPDGIRLAIANRQALFRQELEPEDYERKLLSAVATYLDQPLPTVKSSLPAPSRKSSRQVPWFVAVVYSLLVGGIAAIVTWVTVRPGPTVPRPLARFALDLPAGITLPADVGSLFAISTDGRRIVFNGVASDGVRHLFVRSIDDLDAAPIRGVEGVPGGVYVSPEGEWVAFHDAADGAFKKVRVSGGSPVTIAATGMGGAGGIRGMSWGVDGTIVFSTVAYPGLMRVPDSGGKPEVLTQPPTGERHGYPHLLADGTAVLFVVASADTNEFGQIAVLSLVSGEQRILTEGSFPRVTSSGHLLFAREGSIWAMAFDTDRLQVSGTAVPVLEDVAITFDAHFSVAADGSMAYLRGSLEPSSTLAWVDLNGHETTLTAPPDLYFQPRVSPDGHRVAVRVMSGAGQAVWIHSLERNIATKLTLDDNSVWPIWSPDGKKLMYTSARDGTLNLYERNADGTGVEKRLIRSSRSQFATAWSRDSQQVLYHECDMTAVMLACDLSRLTLVDEPRAELFLATEFNERHPALSPDGRWVAYESNASGEFQIYVRPYPDVDGGHWQISTQGGEQPLWSPDGNTLYYSEDPPSGRMMAVAIETERGLVAGNPEVVFDLGPYRYFGGRNYALHPDGERFLLVKRGDLSEGESQHLILVQNWLEEVKRLVPTD